MRCTMLDHVDGASFLPWKRGAVLTRLAIGGFAKTERRCKSSSLSKGLLLPRDSNTRIFGTCKRVVCARKTYQRMISSPIN